MCRSQKETISNALWECRESAAHIVEYAFHIWGQFWATKVGWTWPSTRYGTPLEDWCWRPYGIEGMLGYHKVILEMESTRRKSQIYWSKIVSLLGWETCHSCMHLKHVYKGTEPADLGHATTKPLPCFLHLQKMFAMLCPKSTVFCWMVFDSD